MAPKLVERILPERQIFNHNKVAWYVEKTGHHYHFRGSEHRHNRLCIYRGSIIRVGVAFYITFCFAYLFGCLLENYFQINVKDNVLDKVTASYCFSELCVKIAKIQRGIYYTVARRYEFYLRVAKQYFTNEHSEWIKYCFCNEKIKFISSSRRVMFFLLYRQKYIDKIIDLYSPKSNCDGSDLQYSNIRHWLQ